MELLLGRVEAQHPVQELHNGEALPAKLQILHTWDPTPAHMYQ